MRASRPSLSIALADFLVDGPHLGRGRRVAVSHAGQSEEIGRKLRTARMQYEGSAQAQHAAEQAGFEDDVVARRSLAGAGGRGSGRAGCRPVVAGEHEGREVDLTRKLDQTGQRGRARIEGRRPGIDMRDVFEAARQASSSFFCAADEPRKMRGLFICSSRCRSGGGPGYRCVPTLPGYPGLGQKQSRLRP